MSLELLMNTKGTLGHAEGSLISGGVFTIISLPAITCQAGDAYAYRGPLQYSFSGGNAQGFDSGSVNTIVPQTINPTALKVWADGQLVIRQGDTGTLTAIGTISGNPATVVGQAEVATAGQDKVYGQ